jgi:signal transduction histidine kinase
VIERRRAFAEGTLGRRASDPQTVEAAGPSTAPPAASVPPPEPVTFEGGRRARIVLVVDQAELREFVRSLLAPTFDVTVAVDGDDGWHAVKRVVPDLVISDMIMPGRSGTELCAAIKRDPALRAIPVVLLTARVGSEATLEGYAYGADDFVAKPFHPAVLMARVRAQLRIRSLGMQVAQQEKFVAIGTLAAGVLHEVRNPVNAILNGGELLRSGNLDARRKATLLDVIVDGARRIESITSALESHARPADDGVTIFSLRDALEATLRLLGHRLGDIAVHRNSDESCVASGHARQLNQVFLNLIDNGLRSGARELWLTIEDLGGGVRIRIGDDGIGISPDVESRVFDPFFTTREPGDGTGLGLHLSRQIVGAHGGRIWFEKRAVRGTEFTIELPAALKGSETERRVS